jgi:hypothetical protein
MDFLKKAIKIVLLREVNIQGIYLNAILKRGKFNIFKDFKRGGRSIGN